MKHIYTFCVTTRQLYGDLEHRFIEFPLDNPYTYQGIEQMKDIIREEISKLPTVKKVVSIVLINYLGVEN